MLRKIYKTVLDNYEKRVGKIKKPNNQKSFSNIWKIFKKNVENIYKKFDIFRQIQKIVLERYYKNLEKSLKLAKI